MPNTTNAILVSGSRRINEGQAHSVGLALRAGLQLLNLPRSETRNTLFIHGTASGLDTIAAKQAHSLGFVIEEHPAQWQTHTDMCPDWHMGLDTCKMAGHRRNAKMIGRALEFNNPDNPALLIAFPVGNREQGLSRGTWQAIDVASATVLPTMMVSGDFFWPANTEAEVLGSRLHKLLPDAAQHVGPKNQVRISWLADNLLPF